MGSGAMIMNADVSAETRLVRSLDAGPVIGASLIDIRLDAGPHRQVGKAHAQASFVATRPAVP